MKNRHRQIFSRKIVWWKKIFFFLDAQKSKKLAGENGPMVLGDDFDDE